MVNGRFSREYKYLPSEVCGQTGRNSDLFYKCRGKRIFNLFSSVPDHATCLSKGFWEDDEDRDPRHQLVHVLGLGLLEKQG